MARRLEQWRQLAREARRPGRRLVHVEYREPTAEVEGVERLDRTTPQGGHGQRPPDGVAPRVDRAQLRADVEVDPARPERPVRSAARRDGLGDLHLGHPELGSAGPDSQPGRGLRRHVRVQPIEDIEPLGARPTDDGGQRGCLLGRLDRDPAERPAVAGGAGCRSQIRRRLADPFQGDPLVRNAGPGCRRPLAAGYDIRPESVLHDCPDDCWHVVCLDRELPDPWVREGIADHRRRIGERREIRDVDRRPEAAGRQAQWRGDDRAAGRAVSRGRQAGRRCSRGSEGRPRSRPR